MRKIGIFMLALAMQLTLNSCKKESSSNNNTNPSIPDLYFEIEVTGDRTDSFSITIPASTPNTSFTVIGSLSKAANLLSINAREVPIGWALGLNTTCQNIEVGTFQSNQGAADITVYSSTGSTPFTYFSTSASVTLTKVTFFTETQNLRSYYADGTFTGTLQDPSDPSKTITVNGSFTGVYLQEA